jgi:hypothetical protein
MNLTQLERLKKQIQRTDNINPLKEELLIEFDRIIHFIKNQLEKDVQTLEKDVEELQKTSINDKHTQEIIGHVIMDFSELRKDLETEI